MKFDSIIDSMKNDIIKTTQDLIKIKSVEEASLEGAPFGLGVKKCLDSTLAICENMGFRTQNFDGYAGHAEFGEGEDLIGILVHLDIVPEGTGWAYDPFGGEVVDGRLYGRGANDDKGPAVAAMYALKAVKDAGVKFNKRIRIIFGCDEESGWECMKHYFKHAEMPSCGFSPDADFPIINSEKGILIFKLNQKFDSQNDNCCDGLKISYIKGGKRPNMVPEYCECLLEMKNDFTDSIRKTVQYMNEKLNMKISAEFSDGKCLLKSSGLSAHGSTPEKGINAISQLISCLCSLPLCASKQVDYLNFINNHIGMETDGRSFGLDMQDEISGKLSFNLGIIDMDEKMGSVCIDIRYPVTKTEEKVYGILRERLKDTEITLVEEDGKAPLYVPADNFMVKTLQSVYEEVTGTPARLISIGGGTYSRAIQNAVAFGPLFPGREENAHEKNEYIEVEDLFLCAKIYAKAIYELVK